MSYIPKVTEGGTQTKSNRILSLALLAALMVVAFLLGRESNRDEPAATTTPAEGVDLAQETASAEQPDQPDSPNDSPFSWETDRESEAEPNAGGGHIERRPDGTVVLSNLRDSEKSKASRAPAKATTSTPSSVDAYFERMNAVQSGHQTADPRSFATSLLTAAMSGSMEGFDQLVDDSERMQREIKAVTPPAGCEAYHQATLDALADSQEIVERLGDAMSRRDMQKIMSVAQEAKALQAKTTELRAMEEEIRGNQ